MKNKTWATRLSEKEIQHEFAEWLFEYIRPKRIKLNPGASIKWRTLIVNANKRKRKKTKT